MEFQARHVHIGRVVIPARCGHAFFFRQILPNGETMSNIQSCIVHQPCHAPNDASNTGNRTSGAAFSSTHIAALDMAAMLEEVARHPEGLASGGQDAYDPVPLSREEIAAARRSHAGPSALR
jgi:hypothetical protein